MALIDLVAERVKILFEGAWREGQVEIVEDDQYLTEITKEMKAVAADRFTDRKKKNPKLFDGDAFHLDLSHSVIQPDRIVLTIGKMKYSLYDIARKEYMDKYGWKTVPTGMATIVTIITSDSKILMHQRSSLVDHIAKISTIGSVYGGEKPFDDIRNEIKEELKISERELENILLVGIYTRLNERINHGLAFFAQTALSSEEVLRREKTLTEKEGEIFFLDKERENLCAYLTENHRDILSDGFVGLVLAGRYLWGKDW